MTYLVLARKWRPRSFDTLIGQDHVVRALTHALQTQRLHHAWLFTGTRGVGKTTLSRLLAKSLNCETGITATPCGKCRACVEIDEGRFVDYVELDAASNRGVDEMTQLLEQAVYAPGAGRFKVYMIDEVHMLTGHAFNAMLKTLEEPPAHVKFILATTDPQKLPATILSRCLQFSLKNMTPERVVEHLSHVLSVENIPFEDDALWLLGRAADGSMREAMSLTDQAIAFGEGKVLAGDVRAMLGTLDHGQVFDLLHALIEGDARALLEAVRHLAEQGPDWNGVLSEILNVFHRVAIAQALPEGLDNGHGDRDRVLALASALPAEDVQFYYQMGLIGRRDLPLAPDPRGGFEMVLLRMLAFRPAGTADAPSQPLKPVGISQATVDSTSPVAATAAVAAPAPAPVAAPVPEAAAQPAPTPAPVVEATAPVVAEIDLPWNEPSAPVIEQEAPPEPVLDTVSEQPELPPMPLPTPDSVVPDAPEWSAAPMPQPTPEQVDAALSGMDRDDEPPLDEDYIEPDMDSAAYSYLDELASEHAAQPAPEPEPLPASMPATGLALEWLNLFPQLPVSGMTASIGANCTLIAVEGDDWLLHLDPAHSALFNATQQRRLNDALNQHLQRTLKVTIELIKPEQETPAQAASRLRAERQRLAEESIYADPLVQQMIKQFDASVRDDTIQPVDVIEAQAS